jgi:hypothetical protein
MSRWQKNLSTLLIAIITLSSTIFLSNLALATKSYAGTKINNFDPNNMIDFKFSELDNSVVYLAYQNSVNFSAFFGWHSYEYLPNGLFINSVSYKASWHSGPVLLYNWSYNDPANLNDDDPAQ